MFETEWGASFTAHLDLIAGTTYLQPTVALADFPTAMPWGATRPRARRRRRSRIPPTRSVSDRPRASISSRRSPTRSMRRRFMEVLRAGSRHAGGIWSSFVAIRKVRYGRDWANVISPQTTILTDAMSGNLPAVSWVVPDWIDSDHPSSTSGSGPFLGFLRSSTRSVESKDWDSTAIFVLWDDWGGFYEDAAPPKTGDYFGPGVRVPRIIISPYAKSHYVTHTDLRVRQHPQVRRK